MTRYNLALTLLALTLGSTGTAQADTGDLSPLAMFMGADAVVKTVMIGLFMASIAAWTIGVVKLRQLRHASAQARAGLAWLKSRPGMPAAGITGVSPVADMLVGEARAEIALSRINGAVPDKAGVKERIASRLVEVEARLGRKLQAGTGILATIGATAPFIGLFGTVWGIMNSFVGIAKTQSTNLAVVAPGIAEALLATAMGLVAAIPAVILYNHFARQIAGVRAQLGDMAGEVMRGAGRELDLPVAHKKPSLVPVAAE